VRALGQQAITLHADLADPDACTRVVTAYRGAAFGRLDILANMASISSQIDVRCADGRPLGCTALTSTPGPPSSAPAPPYPRCATAAE
jgi:NAD(P)-dependent dehydrogenase (short-subunit alcohol dehydrogenase family)